MLCVERSVDGRRIRTAPKNQSVDTIFDGDFRLVVNDGLWTYVVFFYTDAKERVVHVRSVQRLLFTAGM